MPAKFGLKHERKKERKKEKGLLPLSRTKKKKKLVSLKKQ